MAQAVIPQKSATSTEYLRTKVREVVAGAAVDPTAATVKASYRAITDTLGVPTVAYPSTGVSWESAGGQYWVIALLGPSATLQPPGPVAPNKAPITYELWIEVTGGGETVRRAAGLFAVGP
jgi:hypothetical protein